MFTVLPSGQFNEILNLSTPTLKTAAAIYSRRNGTVQHVPSADITKPASNAALGAGASLTIWTPNLGNLIQLCTLTLSTSVAGQYTVQYNAVTIWSGQLPALNDKTIIDRWPGQFLYPINGVLVVINNTAGAVAMLANAWGTEVAA